MSNIWVLAADTTRARVFAAESRGGPLVEMFDLANPDARLHESDLTSDAAGRSANSSTGTSYSYVDDEKKKSTIVHRFAREIAERLEHDRALGEIDKLYIVAERAFVGELRGALDDNTTAILADVVNKNLTRHSPAEIRAVLPDYL